MKTSSPRCNFFEVNVIKDENKGHYIAKCCKSKSKNQKAFLKLKKMIITSNRAVKTTLSSGVSGHARFRKHQFSHALLGPKVCNVSVFDFIKVFFTVEYIRLLFVYKI